MIFQVLNGTGCHQLLYIYFVQVEFPFHLKYFEFGLGDIYVKI